MGQSTATPLQQLLDRSIEGGLARRVAKLRAEGKAWWSVGEAVSEETGIAVTGEILRRWYGRGEEQAS
jgi:hypothetical protein